VCVSPSLEFPPHSFSVPQVALVIQAHTHTHTHTHTVMFSLLNRVRETTESLAYLEALRWAVEPEKCPDKAVLKVPACHGEVSEACARVYVEECVSEYVYERECVRAYVYERECVRAYVCESVCE
jgi:hypothetical protein